MENTKVSALDKIRQQYQKQPPSFNTDDFTAPRCPFCSSKLTIEDTGIFHVEMCEGCFKHIVVEDSKACCGNQDIHMVRLICSNGTVQVKNQCNNCGDVTGNAIGGITKEKRDILPVLNTELRDSYHTKKYQKKSEIYKKFSEQKKGAWFVDYTDYLKSPQWEEKRLLVLKRDKYLCQCCLDAYATQVHHKSYEFVDLKGSEPAFDLVAICKPCHDKIELMKKQK